MTHKKNSDTSTLRHIDTKSPTIAALLQYAIEDLERHDVPDPAVDAEWLLAHLLNCRRSDLQLNAKQELSDDAAGRYRTMINRRAKREPLQYIMGYEEFYGRRFIVKPAVLIPRPETEQLVDLALRHVSTGPKAVLDIGTGSGCIALSIALANPTAHVTGVDLSVDALRVAQENCQALEVSNVRLLAADLIHESLEVPFDLIVSNPPYCEASHWHEIQPEVREHEPVQALLAGPDGLEIIRRIIDLAPQHLRSGGHLLLEFGKGQEAAIAEILDDNASFAEYAFHPDLADITRFVEARRV